MSDYLTIIYTQNIQGQLALLPRYATLIKRLRSESDSDIFLLDAGNSCDNSVHLCDVTDGRASLILLDAMGYEAANVTGFLSEVGRAKLGENYLHMALVDADHSFSQRGITYAASPPTTREHNLYITLRTTPEVRLTPESTHGWVYKLALRTIGAKEIGCVKVAINNTMTDLISSSVHPLTPDILPEPTITSTLEFIQQEAKLYARRQRGEN